MRDTDPAALETNAPSAQAQHPEPHARAMSVPQAGDATCGCGGFAGASARGGTLPSFVYAIGRVEVRFPTLAAEKEYAQATGRADTAGQSDHETLRSVLSERRNRYLLRQLCWVLTIHGLDTYLLAPRDPMDIDLLLETARPVSSHSGIDVVIGTRGRVAPPEMCNGLMVPLVAFDQLYSFDRDALISAIPVPENQTPARFGPAAADLFDRLMRMTDNAGATDEHRAVNYLAVRYPGIYAKAAEEFGRSCSLTAVDVRRSSTSTTRNTVDVIFQFTNRSTGFTEKFFVRVDVTERFPFLVTTISPYYDRI
jgi:hypothetical protein